MAAPPAGHHRNVRSELLVKLALLDRAGVDPRDLLRAQRSQLAPIAAALANEIHTATGYDRALALWRHESVSRSSAVSLRPIRAATAPGRSHIRWWCASRSLAQQRSGRAARAAPAADPGDQPLPGPAGQA